MIEENKQSLPQWLVVAWIVVALVGFVDATYLTIEHFQGGSVECSIIHGCDTVLTSAWSEIAGVPTALFGAGYYLVLLLAGILYADRKSISVMHWAAQCTVVGLIASLWFVYVQAVILQAYCQYCLLSALTSTILFVLGLYVKKFIHSKSASDTSNNL